MLSRKPGVWYGFQKPALVLANDVIFLATPCLSKDSSNLETWSRSLLSASQRLFCVYGLRLWSTGGQTTELGSIVPTKSGICAMPLVTSFSGH